MKKNRFKLALSTLAIGVLVLVMGVGVVEAIESVYPLAPSNPLCEGEINPIDVITLTPTFSWTFEKGGCCDYSAAYQIQVGSTSGANDMWDSKVIVPHAESTVYAGAPLTCGKTYYWRVRTWNNFNLMGPYCEEQNFAIASATIALSASPTSITANGTSTSTITAAITLGGSPAADGTTVTFTTNLGSITPSAATSGGNATTTLTSSTTPGTATVTATFSTFCFISKTTTVAFVSSPPPPPTPTPTPPTPTPTPSPTPPTPPTPEAVCDFNNLLVYPNPFKPNDGNGDTGCWCSGITFGNLTACDAKIRIYTLNGELVKETTVSDVSCWNWDARNEDGEKAASGIYLYLVTNSSGDKKTGKIVIIK